jgi:hypothetical protein
MAALPAIATVAYVGASAGSSIMETVTNASNQSAQMKINEANAKIAENEAAAARAEYANQASIVRSNARRQIASAESSMAAAGNIGSSADAAVLDSMFNLSKDLAALKYNYDSKAVSAENAARNYKYNAAVARRNRTSAIIGGSLKTVAATGAALGQTYDWGFWGKK